MSQPRPRSPTDSTAPRKALSPSTISAAGTFDISILKLRDGIFEVQSTNGDTHLGGDDIDNLLLAVALDEIHAEHGVDLRQHPGAVQALRKAAIDAKITLSAEQSRTSISNSPTAIAISARFRAKFSSS